MVTVANRTSCRSVHVLTSSTVTTIGQGWVLLSELDTRLVSWENIEVAHARNRPLAERPPLPRIGERVWYRAFDWERDRTGLHVPPVQATVIAVEPDDDPDSRDWLPGYGWVRDPNLWHLVRDTNGRPLHHPDGSPRYARVADPWPWLDLELGLDEWGHPQPTVRTRESRMRGSAGWLPGDYRDRSERARLPADFIAASRPWLPPLNVPAAPTPKPAGW